MNRPPTRTAATALLAALASASLAACAPSVPLRVDLRGVSVTVPRLLTPAVELVPPAPQPPPPSLPPLPPLPVVVTPPVVVRPGVPEAPAPACPRASSFAVPERAAAVLLPGPPAPGRSTQRASGTFTATAGPGSLAGSVDVLVEALPDGTSETGQRVQAWQVTRTDRERRSTQVERYRFVHPSGAVSATPPGVYLVGLAWDDATRGPLQFAPAGLGLHVLPQPVALGQAGTVQYAGADTDPGTLTTLALTRNVVGKQRVDACGRLVDTYTVDMAGTLTAPGAQRQVSWTLQLATAYGAVDVASTFTLTSPADGFTWTRTLGATAVPPLPEGVA